jgi:hypothetical protein
MAAFGEDRLSGSDAGGHAAIHPALNGAEAAALDADVSLREVESEHAARRAATFPPEIGWLPSNMEIGLPMKQVPQDTFVSKSARLVVSPDSIDDAISRGWPATTSGATVS